MLRGRAPYGRIWADDLLMISTGPLFRQNGSNCPVSVPRLKDLRMQSVISFSFYIALYVYNASVPFPTRMASVLYSNFCPFFSFWGNIAGSESKTTLRSARRQVAHYSLTAKNTKNKSSTTTTTTTNRNRKEKEKKNTTHQ